jgi:homoserine kinase
MRRGRPPTLEGTASAEAATGRQVEEQAYSVQERTVAHLLRQLCELARLTLAPQTHLRRHRPLSSRLGASAASAASATRASVAANRGCWLLRCHTFRLLQLHPKACRFCARGLQRL